MQQFYIYLQFRTKSPGTFDSPGHWSQPMLTPTSTDPALAWSDLHAGHLKTPGSNARPGTPQDAIWHQELWGVSGPVRSCELCGDVWAPFGILSFVSKKIQKDPKSVKTSESATNEARQYQHYPIFSHRVLQHGFSDGCTLMWGPTVKFQESRPVVWDMPGLRWCHVFQSTKSLEKP